MGEKDRVRGFGPRRKSETSEPPHPNPLPSGERESLAARALPFSFASRAGNATRKPATPPSPQRGEGWGEGARASRIVSAIRLLLPLPSGERELKRLDRHHAGHGFHGAGDLGRDFEAAGEFDFDFAAVLQHQHHADFAIGLI